MKSSNMVQILTAAALSSYVSSNSPEYGGIFLISPPGQLKTSMIMKVAAVEETRVVSDLTTRDLNLLKDEIVCGKVRTLIFPDFQKIYERKSETSSNIVGHLRSLMDEGFIPLTAEGGASDLEIRARAVVLAAMTPHLERYHRNTWKTGISRRVLMSNFVLDKPRQIQNSLVNNERIALGAKTIFAPTDGEIPWSITRAESGELNRWLRYQTAQETGLTLFQKILCVLRWNFRRLHEKDRSMEVACDFAESLQPGGCRMELDQIELKGALNGQ